MSTPRGQGPIDRLTGPVCPHKELIRRLAANRCELCERPGEVEAHHVKSLNELQQAGDASSDWVKMMVARRRKTLVVCGSCHDRIHRRKPSTTRTQ
ncbi:HNH endonuclease [Streptomyces guryensis]|uniref:HNH endonuclease n=1 Tax=Streptomyces guryensis TaxID=2886947 RepID=UPI0035575FEB